jgi:hypothetical protein
MIDVPIFIESLCEETPLNSSWLINSVRYTKSAFSALPDDVQTLSLLR